MSLRHTLRRAFGTTSALFFTLCLLAAAVPAHAVWGWMRGSAVTDFQASDWAMLEAAAADLLNNRQDNEQVNWSNPETGNRGSLIVLATFAHQGQVCRRAAMRNMTHRGRDDKAAYSLCRQDDGEWDFVPESAFFEDEDANPD